MAQNGISVQRRRLRILLSEERLFERMLRHALSEVVTLEEHLQADRRRLQKHVSVLSGMSSVEWPAAQGAHASAALQHRIARLQHFREKADLLSRERERLESEHDALNADRELLQEQMQCSSRKIEFLRQKEKELRLVRARSLAFLDDMEVAEAAGLGRFQGLRRNSDQLRWENGQC